MSDVVKAALDSGEWQEKTDKKTGKKYYYNKKLKKTVWDLEKELTGGGKTKAGKKDSTAEAPKKEEGDEGKKAEGKKAAKADEKKEQAKAGEKKDAKAGEKEDKKGAEGKTSKEKKDTAPSEKDPLAETVKSDKSKGRSETGSKGGPVIQEAPVDVIESDDPQKGKLMAVVTMTVGSGSNPVTEGPEKVYGDTDAEVRCAAQMRREELRQRCYNRLPLRDYLHGDDDASVVSAADYWEDTAHQGPCPHAMARPISDVSDEEFFGTPTASHHPSPLRYSLPHSAHPTARPPYATSWFPQPHPPVPPPTNYSNSNSALLRAAAARGDLPMVQRLIALGAPINEGKAGDGKTALHHAARHGHVQVVDHLLHSGADPFVADARGRTPADLALQYGQQAVSRRLEASGGSPGRLRAHWTCPPEAAEPKNTRRLAASWVPPQQPTSREDPSTACRKLSEDVSEAMQGVTALVQKWIRDWAPEAGRGPPPATHPQPAVPPPQPLQHSPAPKAASPMGSPQLRSVSPPRNTADGDLVAQLAAQIWQAASAQESLLPPQTIKASAPVRDHYAVPSGESPRRRRAWGVETWHPVDGSGVVDI